MLTSSSHKKGASAQYASLKQKLIAYSQSHQSMSVNALFRLTHKLSDSLLIWLAIAIFLTLPCGLYLLIDHLQKFRDPLTDIGSITAFIKQDINDAELLQLNQTIKKNTHVLTTNYLSSDKALEEFKHHTNMSKAFTHITDNPLPGVLSITLKWNTPHTQLKALLTQLNQLPEVLFVQSDIRWIKRLSALLDAGQRLTATVGSLLSIAIWLVVHNTLRLSITARRDEIRIIHLIGGSHAYIRRPFLYEGFWHGLIGGLLACILLMLCLGITMPSINHFISLYDTSIRLQPFTLKIALYLVVLPTLIGWLSAFWAVNRHLARLPSQ